MQIKSFLYSKILFEDESKNFKETLENAVKAEISLQEADLIGANLEGVNLQWACLQGSCLQGADLRGSNLEGVNLQGACLQGSDLQFANLRKADLRESNLQGVNLQGANLQDNRLQGAYLEGADLRFANLKNIIMAWNSHRLVSEILFRAAQGDYSKESFAAWVDRKVDWCWEKWKSFQHPLREWAIEELRKFIKEGDNVPEFLRIKKD